MTAAAALSSLSFFLDIAICCWTSKSLSSLISSIISLVVFSTTTSATSLILSSAYSEQLLLVSSIVIGSACCWLSYIGMTKWLSVVVITLGTESIWGTSAAWVMLGPVNIIACFDSSSGKSWTSGFSYTNATDALCELLSGLFIKMVLSFFVDRDLWKILSVSELPTTTSF